MPANQTNIKAVTQLGPIAPPQAEHLFAMWDMNLIGPLKPSKGYRSVMGNPIPIPTRSGVLTPSPSPLGVEWSWDGVRNWLTEWSGDGMGIEI